LARCSSIALSENQISTSEKRGASSLEARSQIAGAGRKGRPRPGLLSFGGADTSHRRKPANGLAVSSVGSTSTLASPRTRPFSSACDGTSSRPGSASYGGGANARWTVATHKRFEKRFPLPKVAIVHPWPDVRFAPVDPTWERGAGNPLASVAPPPSPVLRRKRHVHPRKTNHDGQAGGAASKRDACRLFPRKVAKVNKGPGAKPWFSAHLSSRVPPQEVPVHPRPLTGDRASKRIADLARAYRASRPGRAPACSASDGGHAGARGSQGRALPFQVRTVVRAAPVDDAIGEVAPRFSLVEIWFSASAMDEKRAKRYEYQHARRLLWQDGSGDGRVGRHR
jgi:hypothetical protein